MLDAAALLAWPPAARRRRELQPLLYGLLEGDGRLGELAADERTFARAAYVNTRARSVLLRETLLEVAAVAATEGVPILPLKGALLAFTAYPDPGLRPMGDLDLAVRPADAEPLAARAPPPSSSTPAWSMSWPSTGPSSRSSSGPSRCASLATRSPSPPGTSTSSTSPSTPPPTASPTPPCGSPISPSSPLGSPLTPTSLGSPPPVADGAPPTSPSPSPVATCRASP